MNIFRFSDFFLVISNIHSVLDSISIQFRFFRFVLKAVSVLSNLKFSIYSVISSIFLGFGSSRFPGFGSEHSELFFCPGLDIT